jgi:hypothetical protein
LLLREVLDLSRDLGGATDRSDFTYISQPSIEDHTQNKQFRDWTALIDLCRDGWIEIAKEAAPEAIRIAQDWFRTPYPIFKRLALFAATTPGVVPPALSTNWLLEEDAWWLWSVETQREVMRLLASIASLLDLGKLEQLENAVLLGPPRDMFRNEIEAEHWARIQQSEKWRLLSQLHSHGAPLSERATVELTRLRDADPTLNRAPNERDEFPSWMSDGSELRQFAATPRRRRDLAIWIRENPKTSFWEGDDWRSRCSSNFATTASVLFGLARSGYWPVDRWRDAFQAWAEERLLLRSWRRMRATVLKMPAETFADLAPSVSWWLREVSGRFEVGQDDFFLLCRRILDEYVGKERETDDPVSRAINHPIGHVTEAILRRWYRTELAEGQGLAPEFREILDVVCNVNLPQYRHGRVILAANLLGLFRVDPDWSKQKVLARFDWQESNVEAKSAWEGFLWTLRVYPPLVEVLKPYILQTPQHFDQLGEHGEQFAMLLTFVALEMRDLFLISELATATRQLPDPALQYCVRALVSSMGGTSERRATYFQHRIAPYMQRIWPKQRTSTSDAVAENFARLCVEAEDAFEIAVKAVRPWLQQLKHPDFIVHRLFDLGLCEQFPVVALDFLDVIVGERSGYPPTELGSCLNVISNLDESVLGDARFKRLKAYVELHGKA